jgi:hypothetical protein
MSGYDRGRNRDHSAHTDSDHGAGGIKRKRPSAGAALTVDRLLEKGTRHITEKSMLVVDSPSVPICLPLPLLT